MCIRDRSISAAKITVADQVYTGAPLTPEITVTLGGKQIADTEYDVGLSADDLTDRFYEAAEKYYEAKEAAVTSPIMRELERVVLPVSYTHLDVYKRQPHSLPQSYQWQSCCHLQIAAPHRQYPY